MRGPLGRLYSILMGERIAESFRPLLDGLAPDAETTSSA